MSFSLPESSGNHEIQHGDNGNSRDNENNKISPASSYPGPNRKSNLLHGGHDGIRVVYKLFSAYGASDHDFALVQRDSHVVQATAAFDYYPVIVCIKVFRVKVVVHHALLLHINDLPIKWEPFSLYYTIF